MWRRFRYYLTKDFPKMKIEFKRLSGDIWEITMPEKGISMTFNTDKSLRKDMGMFFMLYNNIKIQIKDLLFPKKKR